MSAETLAGYIVVAVLGGVIGGIRKHEIGRVLLCLLVALFGAGLLGYYLGVISGNGGGRVAGWVGLSGLLLIPLGCLMALFALPQAGFDRLITRGRRADD